MIAGPKGNPAAPVFTMFGCPTYGSGEKCNMIETILTHAQPALLKWIQRVALEGANYVNMEPDVVGDGAGLSPEQMQQFMAKWNAAEEAHAKGGGPIINAQEEKGPEQTAKTSQNGASEVPSASSITAFADPKDGNDEGVEEVAKDLKGLKVKLEDGDEK